MRTDWEHWGCLAQRKGSRESRHPSVPKVGYRKDGKGLSISEYSDRIMHNGYKMKEAMFNIDTSKKFFTQSDESLKHIAQTNCGCPVSVHGQPGWGFEQSGLVEGVPVHSRGVGTRSFLRSLLIHTILQFHDKSSHSLCFRLRPVMWEKHCQAICKHSIMFR